MAQTKFKLNVEEEESITHAHAQNEQIKETQKVEKKLTPMKVSGVPLLAGFNLGSHLLTLFEIMTPTQKQQLIKYSESEYKQASEVIKELLIEKGIIEEDK